MSPRLLRPRASGLFDPRTIGTMRAWYDFSDSSTLTLVNSLVSEIRNKSGTAPTLSQSVEANRPSLSSIGGRQAALFDGSNDHLFSNTAVRGEGTLFGVYGRTGDASVVAAAFGESTPNIVQFAIGVTTGGDGSGDPIASGRFSGAGGVLTATRINSAASTVVVSSTFALTTAPTIRANGTAGSVSSSAQTGNRSHAAIGARNSTDTYGLFWNSTVGEVLFYSSVLSESQITSVERYLAAKWGITL
jgi:hypothetical protein